MKPSWQRWMAAMVLMTAALVARGAEAATIDPRATEQLRRMSDFLAKQDTFALRVNATTEVVLKNGQKLEYDNSSQVLVNRPNMLRSQRQGQDPASLYYDGNTLTLYTQKERMYATTEAPPRLDQALDFARESLGVEAPGADLLYPDSYDLLMENVQEATYLGTSVVNGVPCHHLAFRGPETDWQLWIGEGARPLPQKLVIASKTLQGAPEFRVEVAQWDLAPKTKSSDFRFNPPAGATRINFELEPTSEKPTGEPAERPAEKPHETKH